MKQKKSSFINLGFSSIVMVFIMICLVTFASLSVLTAYSDYKLSQKMADKTTAYYEADVTARNRVAEIDAELFSLYLSSASEEEYWEEIESVFADYLLTNQDEIQISYTVPVTEVQTLYVTLGVHYPHSGSEYFTTIERWQTVTENAPEESEDYLNLFTGNE